MLIKPLQTKDEIIKEVRSQLSRFIMSETHSIKWLENESRLETEYPIRELVAQAGYNSTEEFLHEELYGYVSFAGPGLIKAGRQLYDNPNLQHIVSLQARTELVILLLNNL
uniref:Uncharacterized protein n=1 Tax=Panagrolaimus sp. PS1159 TaxID=55785 RepID=A0AC35GYG6_9BILA